jgi:EAL domain-containing protein (putative c-di-GMP-specific phosphodiesterase class I)
MKMKWCIEASANTNTIWQVTIESVPFVIGRADNCNLKLIDDRISRHHSEIRISGDLLWIRDLDSTNGTFVNQVKIDQAQLLDPDDIISIGKYKLKVKILSSSSSITVNETVHETFSKNHDNYDLSSLGTKLQLIIDKRIVNPHFQPILSFSDMATIGYEILGRIDDESLPSNPAELLDCAEYVGCGSELSSLFREEGVRFGKDLPGSPIFFVNSSKFEIYEIDTLLASMKRIRDIATSNKIVLEINEKAAANVNDLPVLQYNLGEMNIGLAFDDFGVGQTRLVELSNTPPDYLKFDSSLICKINLAPNRLHQMISTFIKVSHDLGILTIAEGVESPEESEVCKELGFDFGQGFLFGRPSPIHAFKKVLSSL